MRLKLAMVIVLSGCVSNHKNFNTFKSEPFQSKNTFPINGIYLLKNFSTTKYYDRPHAIFFYADGSISAYNTNQLSKISEREFWTYPEEYLSTVDLIKSPGQPGHFTFKNDTLTIEFITYRGGIPELGSNRFEGIIDKDSTIILTKQVCRWCPKRIKEFPDDGMRNLSDTRYDFYKTDIRPDSSGFWIKKSKWYKKQVWNRQ